MNILPLTIEAMVSILLLLTILYCVRLNAQLKRLRSDEAAMRTTIMELMAATNTAERAITGLKMTVRETEQVLGDRLKSAETYSGEMARQLETGQELLSRITQIIGAREPRPEPAASDSPDAKSIAAAAQAFAARAQSRVRGLAA